MEMLLSQDGSEQPQAQDTPVATPTPKAKRYREKPGRELTSAQTTERDRISEELQTAHEELEAAVSAYNNALEELKNPVEEALEKLNAALSDARDLRDEIVNDAEEYIGERSEKWQDGEAGQAVSEYKSSWEYAEIEEASIEFPEQIEMPDIDPEVLVNLPESAEA